MPVIAITIGDPAGIGPEVAVKALSLPLPDRVKVVLIGHRKPVEDAIKIANLNLKFPEISLPFSPQKLPPLSLLSPGNRIFPSKISYGRPTIEGALFSYEYIRLAVSLALEKKVSSIVTMPISKFAFSLAKLSHKGHTEMLKKMTGTSKVTMLLGAKRLRFALVTTHMPLSKVSSSLSTDKVVETAVTAKNALQKIFHVRNPKIAICAFNPHAGENGLFGKEEKEVILPALDRLKTYVKKCELLPADVAVQKTNQGLFDLAVAVYHDQALIPLKSLYPNYGYNLTVGLPFIRTSPLHGTGFDIAGKNKANPCSAIDAISLATKVSRDL